MVVQQWWNNSGGHVNGAPTVEGIQESCELRRKSGVKPYKYTLRRL